MAKIKVNTPQCCCCWFYYYCDNCHHCPYLLVLLLLFIYFFCIYFCVLLLYSLEWCVQCSVVLNFVSAAQWRLVGGEGEESSGFPRYQQPHYQSKLPHYHTSTLPATNPHNLHTHHTAYWTWQTISWRPQREFTHGAIPFLERYTPCNAIAHYCSNVYWSTLGQSTLEHCLLEFHWTLFNLTEM